MPVTQFIDGNQFVQSVTSGQRITFALAELQRSLRDQDRQFIFNQQADPFRLQALQAEVRSATAKAEVDANTTQARIISERANASILRDNAEFSQATNPIRIRTAELTGQQNEQRAVLNTLTLEQSLDAFEREPAVQTRDQAISAESARIAGADTSKIPFVDFNKTSGRRNQVVAAARERLGSNFTVSSGTPERDFQTGERIVEDLQLGGPISQALTQAGLTPQAQLQFVQPYITAAETAASATEQVGTLVAENRKLTMALQKNENRVLELQRDIIQGTAAPFQINTAPLQANPGIQPIDPNAVAATPAGPAATAQQPAATPTPQADTTRPATVSRIMEIAPVTPQVAAQLIPIEAFGAENVFSIATLPSIVTTSGGFQFEGVVEPAVQVGVSESGEDGAPSVPIVDPRGPTGDIYYAMMTQESRNRQFDSRGRTIVSPSGAVGIGQLLPSTAREVAERHGIPYSRARLYNDANYNSNLGKLYFDGLMKTFKNTTVAIAAYNMGPGNANNAIRQLGDPRRGEVSEADWVQRLPTVRRGGRQLRGLSETRDYVRKVYGFYNNRRRGGN